MSKNLGFITVHEDSELSAILGEEIASRETLHAWPLSSVERVRLRGGETRIYKSQRASASVERAFYAKISDPLLTKPLYSGTLEESDILVLPELGSPADSWQQQSAEEMRCRIERLSAEIQRFEGAPVFRDFSRPESLPAALEEVASVLLGGGLAEEELSRLRAWTEGPARACWDAPVGLVHGDLKGDNVLFAPDGREILIDWQRPMLAPLPLETAHALHSIRRGAEAPGPFGALAEFLLAYWYAWAWDDCLKLPFVQKMGVNFARSCLEFIE